MAAKKTARKRAKKTVVEKKEPDGRVQQARKAAFAMLTRLDEYKDHQHLVFRTAKTDEEWRLAVNRHLEALTFATHASLSFSVSHEYALEELRSGLNGVATALISVLPEMNKTFVAVLAVAQEFEGRIAELEKAAKTKRHRKLKLPDLDKMLVIARIVQTVATVFGHVEHDLMKILPRVDSKE